MPSRNIRTDSFSSYDYERWSLEKIITKENKVRDKAAQK